MPSKPNDAIVIGLVGGVASGKSYVANVLVEMGAGLVSADTIGHEVLQQPLVVRKLAQDFGDSILSGEEAGFRQISRQRLAELVFGMDSESEARRKKLEETIHPLIHAEAVRRLRGFKEQDDPPRAIVIDAPLLLEAGWEPLCDLILFVDAPRSLRLERARQRGWSEAEFDYREAAQRTLDDKRRAATNIVHSTDPKQLRKELRQLWDKF